MTPKFTNLVDLYQRSVREFGSRPVFGTKIHGNWSWMTYRDFGQQVDEIRAGLAAMGVTQNDSVAIIANNRPEWAIAAYATYGRGAVFVPMYENQLDKEWKYILDDCDAKVVFVANESIRDAIQKLRVDLPSLGHIVVLTGQGNAHSTTFNALRDQGRRAPTPAIVPAESDISGFIYTSGTTGNPKGVRLSHGNFASNVSAIHEVFPMLPEDRSLSFLPWAHSFGQTVELHCLLSMGASMGIAESVEKIVDNLAEVQPTLLFSVPRIFNRIHSGLQKRMAAEGGLKKTLFYAGLQNAQTRKRLSAEGRSSTLVELKHRFFDKVVFSKVRARFGGRLKYAFSGGAAISKEVADFVDDIGILVYEGYGLTETSPIATANWPGNRKIGSVGKAIPQVRIEIDTTATGDEKNGEVIVYGPNVMQGYHKLPEDDAKVFIGTGKDRGFRTGDMGYLDTDGFLYITGRIKEQYKLENGKYVSPAPLEEKLKLAPLVTNIMVYGDNRPYNVALVVADVEAVKAWCKEQNIDAPNTDAMLADTRVIREIESQLERKSADFKQFEKIHKIALISEDFTTQNDMLTPSLKVKRRTILAKYGPLIHRLYA